MGVRKSKGDDCGQVRDGVSVELEEGIQPARREQGM